MKTVTAAEFTAEPEKVLAWVREGEAIELLENDKRVAHIAPCFPASANETDFSPQISGAQWAEELRAFREATFPNGPIAGDPQEFWDFVRGDR